MKEIINAFSKHFTIKTHSIDNLSPISQTDKIYNDDFIHRDLSNEIEYFGIDKNIYIKKKHLPKNYIQEKDKPSLNPLSLQICISDSLIDKNRLQKSSKNIGEIWHNKYLDNFQKIKGFVYILLGCFLATIVNFLYKYATSNKIPPMILLFYRGINLSIISSIYLKMYFSTLKNEFTKTKIKSLLSRALMNSIALILIFSSLNHIRLNTLELLLRIGNLMGVFVGYLIINEIITKWDILSLIVTFFGVIFILKPYFLFDRINDNDSAGKDNFYGLFLASCCTVINSFGNVLTKTIMNDFNEIYLILSYGVMSILFGFLISVFHSHYFNIGIFYFFYTFFISIMEFYSNYFIFKSFKFESNAKLSPFYNSRIVFSVAITYVFYGQIDKYDLIGSFLITGIYVFSSYMKIKE